MASYFYIVSREHPRLYQYLRQRFADDRNVRVILDRRCSAVLDRRCSAVLDGHGAAPDRAPLPERGPLDRRRRPHVDEEIRLSAHAVVDLDR